MAEQPQVSRILKIATDVRRELIGTMGSVCDPEGQCTRASTMISSRLARAGISHEVVGGWFLYGSPIPDSYEMEHGQMKVFEAERQRVGRGHTWIRFPQHDNDILDVTADQFDPSVPGVWFPADPNRYDGRVFVPVKAHHPKRPADIANRFMYGRIYPRPVEVRSHLRRSVVRHLKNPPKACLCHRSRRVDNLRKSLIRRLDK